MLFFHSMKEYIALLSEPIALSSALVDAMMLLVLIISMLKKSWRQKSLRWVQSAVLSALLTSVSMIYLVWVQKTESLVVVNLWLLIQLILFSGFFCTLLPTMKKLILTCTFLLILHFLYTVTIVGTVFEYSKYIATFQSIYFVLVSLTGFYFLFVDQEYSNILAVPEFWVLSGTLLYFSGALFSFLLSDRVFTYNISAITGLWFLHNIFNLIRYVFYGIGFMQVSTIETEEF